MAKQQIGKAAKKKEPAPETEPLTSPCVLTPNEALALGKSMQKEGALLEAAAKKRGAELAEGPHPIDVEMRLIDRPIVSAPSAGSEGRQESAATVHPLDLLVSLVADECGADMIAIDAFVEGLVARRKKVVGTKSGAALLANVAEVLVEKVESAAMRAGFIETRTVGASVPRAGAVRCDPKLEVKKVRR